MLEAEGLRASALGFWCLQAYAEVASGSGVAGGLGLGLRVEGLRFRAQGLGPLRLSPWALEADGGDSDLAFVALGIYCRMSGPQNSKPPNIP